MRQKNIIKIWIIALFVITLYSCDSTDPKPPDTKPPGYQEDISWPPLADSPWPMNRCNPQSNGRSKIKGISIIDSVQIVESWEISSNIIVLDSTLFYTSSDFHSGGLYSYNPGTEITQKLSSSGTMSITAPVADKNNIIYYANIEKVFAVSRDGELKWEFQPDASVQISPQNIVLDKEGNIYFNDFTNTLYCLSKDGSLLWKLTEPDFWVGNKNALVFSSDAKLLIIQGLYNKLLYAVDLETRSISWSFGETDPSVGGPSPVVNSDNEIFAIQNSVTGDSSKLFCLSKEGEVKWSHDFEERIYTQPTIDKYGNIFLGTKYLYSYDYKGEFRFKLDTGGDIVSGLVCDADSKIYLFLSNSVRDLILSIYDNDGNLINNYSSGETWGVGGNPTLFNGGIAISTSNYNNFYIIHGK